MPDRQRILKSIATIATKLGRAPSRAEFVLHTGISMYFVLKSFRDWSEAVRAAGLRPSALNARIEDRALLEDWGQTVRTNGGLLPRHMFRRAAKYNPCTLAKRFGNWSAMPQVFRKFARGKSEWADVVALLPGPGPSRVPRKNRQRPQRNSTSAASPGERCHAPLKGRPTYGDPTPFRWLPHAPVNEQGVVLLFGMFAKELGYIVENAQKGFPDCEALRQIAAGRWQRVRIEFEYESRNFREHGHATDGCDVIVCWRHNWDGCPKHLEILELSTAIKSLRSSGNSLSTAM